MNDTTIVLPRRALQGVIGDVHGMTGEAPMHTMRIRTEGVQLYAAATDRYIIGWTRRLHDVHMPTIEFGLDATDAATWLGLLDRWTVAAVEVRVDTDAHLATLADRKGQSVTSATDPAEILTMGTLRPVLAELLDAKPGPNPGMAVDPRRLKPFLSVGVDRTPDYDDDGALPECDSITITPVASKPQARLDGAPGAMLRVTVGDFFVGGLMGVVIPTPGGDVPAVAWQDVQDPDGWRALAAAPEMAPAGDPR